MSFRRLISSRRVAPLALALVFAGFSSSASAHVGLHTGGLADGLAHPFSGADHLLAMVAVGLWAAQLGRTARWALPAAFLAAMALGAVVGASGLALPWIELGIAASVVVLGAAIAFSLTPTLAVSSSLIAAFALLHGYTHGAELPQAASGFAYGAGFTTATLALQAVGLALGTISRGRTVRAAGAAIAAVGVALLVTA